MRAIPLQAIRCALAGVALAAVALAGGCAEQAPLRAGAGDEVAACELWFAALRRTVDEAGTGDAEAPVVAGRPYLRADRLLASFAGEDLAAPAFAAWVDRLAALGADGDRVEIANLPAAARAQLDRHSRALVGLAAPAARAHCAGVLRTHDLATAAGRAALRAAVEPPDHYLDWRRVVGLYPLTAVPVAVGFARWKRLNLDAFDHDPRTLPLDGRLVTYRPEAGAGALPRERVATMLARASANPLAMPEPEGDDAEALVAAFAPVWQVDTVDGDDRIGAIRLGDAGPVVDTASPVVYHRFSHTRLGDRVLLQINYLAWFPARPKSGALDLLGGRLDGVVWRVTLGADGAPLAYDTMHACGCYHLFFPVAPVRLRPGPPPRDIRERAEVPALAPRLQRGQRIVLRIAAASHYVQGLHAAGDEASETVGYRLAPAAELRSLAAPGGGRRSLYRPDGLVAGSERLERFLLWPMGIDSAGAMRQWGTHATAFVGRRHFDDPRLFDDAFEWPRAADRR